MPTADDRSELKSRVLALRKARGLHRETASQLVSAVQELFPDWTSVPEIGQTAGGRNDLVLFEGDGKSVCFEVFGSASQVDRDTLLLYESPADVKIAVLMNRDFDAAVATAYYRRRPKSPFPVVWLSDVLDPGRRSLLQMKLLQYVVGVRLQELDSLWRAVRKTDSARFIRKLRADGVDIAGTDFATNPPTFLAVFTLLAVTRLRTLGLSWAVCERAAKHLNDKDRFDWIVSHVVLGVPMLLVCNDKDVFVYDHGDYLIYHLAIHNTDPGHVLVSLNSLYDQMRDLHTGGVLPESGDWSAFLRSIGPAGTGLVYMGDG